MELKINQPLWQAFADQQNVEAQAKVQAANEQITQRALARGIKAELQPDAVPLSAEEYAAKVIAEKEIAIESAQDASRDKAILAASPEAKARFLESLK